MSERSDELVKVVDFPALLTILESELPLSITFYGWLKTRMLWHKRDPNTNPFHVYCPNGNIKNGLIGFGDIDGRTYIITIFTFDNNFSKLAPLLLTTNKVKWSEAITIGINKEHTKEIESILNKLGYTVHTDISSKLWDLNLEEALAFKIECPDEVYLAPLLAENIPTINSTWSLKFEGSEQSLLRLIQLNNSIGLFTKQDDELIAWAVECEYSEIGVLFTVPEQRKKGYGTLVVKELARRIADDKGIVTTYTVHGNTKAEELFFGIGFSHVCEYGFLEYEKTKA